MRAGEWWEFKLLPVLATGYATAFLLKTSIISLWPQLVVALVALAVCAADASVVNDLADFNDDRASGKANRLVGKSRAFVTATLAGCVLLGLAVAFYWRSEPLMLSSYAASWIILTLYSLPPFRLKSRGVLGLLACASGEQLFPSLLIVSVVNRQYTGPMDVIWFVSVATWSLSFGLRGILWHQLTDRQNDEKVGLSTFARRHETAWLRRLGNFIIFPLELAAFCFMLWHAGSRVAITLLCYYAMLTYLRKRLWGVNLVVVVPKPRYQIVMQEYSEVFFPLAFLLSSSLRFHLDALIIVPHLLLFPRRAFHSFKDAKIFKHAFELLIRRILKA